MKFKIIHITDLHFNPFNRIPQSRTETFHQDISNKWDCLCTAIEREKEDCDDIIGVISGDIFHLKNSNLYYPSFINEYVKYFQKTGIDWYSIPGNHDLPKSSYGELEQSAYHLLTQACSNIHDVSHNQEKFSIKDKFDIVLTGLPYYPLNDLFEKSKEIKFKNNCFNVLLLHTDALPDDSIFTFWDIIGYDKLLELFPKVSLICLGHIHQSFPVYKKETSYISKPWSFSRVVRDYYNQIDDIEKNHKPSYSLTTFNLNKNNDLFVSVEYKEIPHISFEVAFLKDDLKREIEKNKKISGFIDRIKHKFGSEEEAFKIIDPGDYLSKVSIPEEVRVLIQEYLEV